VLKTGLRQGAVAKVKGVKEHQHLRGCRGPILMNQGCMPAHEADSGA